MTKWIKTSERLPKLNKDVLLYNGSADGLVHPLEVGRLITRRISDYSWETISEHNHTWYLERFPYWMPLPEPPK